MRLRHLDGLRGLACLQVMLLHVFSAFFPALVFGPLQPAGVLRYGLRALFMFSYNGFVGVFIFFYISGYVLTRVYEASSATIGREIAARVLRLWLPTTIFGLWSAALFLVFPTSHIQLGTLTHNLWIVQNWAVDPHLAAMTADIFIRPIFLGYHGAPITQILPDLDHLLIRKVTTLNLPVHTMSAELQGSALVLALTRLRRSALSLWAMAIVAAILLLPLWYVLFCIGHLCATLRLGERDWRANTRAMSGLAVPCIILGILFAWPLMGALLQMIGAGLFFVGVLISVPCRRFLSHRWLLRLGDLSFTLYLLHWALLFGPGAWLALHLIPLLGFTGARIAAALCVLLGAPALAWRLIGIDRWAVALSRRVKQAGSSRRTAWNPAPT
ncbi:MAG: acyltransferase [Rhodospirillales bacterium]|nr:acyltransferase [Rhodospirillales bacterium]